MNKVIFLLSFLTLFWLKSSAQFTHSGRGMYVDKFFRTAINTSGVTVVNPVYSILSVQSKEDSLLQYAKDNHFTYLILYDLYYVFGNPTFENYLCAFIQKAKNQYCIEEIGVASSCSSLFDNIFNVSATPAISFSDPRYSSKYNTESKNKLQIVEDIFVPGDSLFYESEVTKLAMRAAVFNDGCPAKIDVLVSEYEFWNTAVDDCLGDNPSKDVRYTRYQTLINNMDVIRDNYNLSHGSHQVFVETYLGYLNQNTAYTHQAIADWVDGTYAGKRRVDRINTHYYGSDPSRLYSRTATGQNNSGYYLTRFQDFCQASTVDQTYLHPIFSSEYIPWGSGATYLGSWFSQGVNNNIFTAEKYYYNDWNDDAQNYHQTTVGSPTLGTIVHPGGVQWFTASKLVGHLNNPILFTTNSPVCVASGQNGTFQFQYQGPIEQGISYKFYLTNAGNSTVRCGSTNSIPWPVYNPITQTSIDLNGSLGGCSLPIGDYDAHLELTYASGCTYIVPQVRVSIVNTGKIVALTPTSVCQGHPVFLQANSSGGGTTTYAWYDGTTVISGATSSTYAPPATSTGNHTYSCLITSSVAGCSANRSNIIPVTINTFPAATITTQSSSSCSVTLQANPAGGTYLWHDGSTGPTYSTGFSGTYSVAVTLNGCTSLSPKFTVSSLSGTGTVVPLVTIAANTGNSICSGATVVFTATPTNGGSAPVYQWKKNGVNVGTNSSTYSISNLVNNDAISCVMTSNLSCASPVTANSNSVSMTVNSNVTPVVSIASSQGNVICTGTSVTFTATPVNGGAAPLFQWKKNGNNVGTNSNAYSDNALASSDVINCVMTSNANCVSPATATSGNITMTVNPLLNPAVSIVSNSSNPICDGTNVTFTATPVNGGASPTYQWKRNGVNTGTNSNSYSSSSLVNNDAISCTMTSNATCISTANATSNAITILVNSIVAPSVTINANTGNSICGGTNVIFSASPVNGGASPAYQWKKNGNNVGTNSSSYSTSLLSTNDILSCVMTSSLTCSSPVTATSNSISMTVNSVVTPTVDIYSNQGNSICSGVLVTFSAIPNNGGATQYYQWKKNGTNVGTQNYLYSDNGLISSDVISCEMTSTAACASPVLVSSNNITMTVNPSVVPSINITADQGNNICQGSNVVFTAVPVNGGTVPSFHWKLNGQPIGGNSNTYSNNSLVNNDYVNCIMASNATCAVPSAANSNFITMSVNSNSTPSITINSNTGSTICAGTNVTFTASPVNGGNTPFFQWRKNGINVGYNLDNYSDNNILNSDIISCSMTSSINCSNPAVVTSNFITMNVVSNIVPSVSITASNSGNSICNDTRVTFTATPVNGGIAPVYQWVKRGNFAGTNSNTFTDDNFLNNDIVYCLMTSDVTCGSTDPAISNFITLNVVPCNFLKLNLKVLIQGYYRGNNKMAAVVNPSLYPMLCDTITVELHYSSAPNNVAYSKTDTIDINGNGKFIFPSVVMPENYFIVVRHRNALETWSNTPVFINSSILNYDFSTSAGKAYGNNQADLGDGNFALWSGDVSSGTAPGVQDGAINNYDHIEIEKSVQLFNTGYLINDLTGDKIIESADFSLVEHNDVIPIVLSRP